MTSYVEPIEPTNVARAVAYVSNGDEETTLYGHAGYSGPPSDFDEETEDLGNYLFTSIVVDGTEFDADYLYQNNGKILLTQGYHNIVYNFREDRTHIIGGSFWTWDNGIKFVSFTIPKQITAIETYAFADQHMLTSITIPNSVTCFPYDNCGDDNGCCCDGYAQFESCTSLVQFNFEEDSQITCLPSGFLAACYGLTSITIPNSVTSIGGGAFEGCSGLTSITIPSGVTSIDYEAFLGCNDLTSITCLATTPPTLENYAFPDNGCPIYVPSGSVNAYKAADGWSTYASRIQAIP